MPPGALQRPKPRARTHRQSQWQGKTPLLTGRNLEQDYNTRFALCCGEKREKQLWLPHLWPRRMNPQHQRSWRRPPSGTDWPPTQRCPLDPEKDEPAGSEAPADREHFLEWPECTYFRVIWNCRTNLPPQHTSGQISGSQCPSPALPCWKWQKKRN